MHRIIFLAILILFVLSSCFKEDERLKPYNGTITTIHDPVQTNTSYFDFETDSVIASVPSQTWQLGFECTAEGWHIITNSGANWFMYNTGQTDLNSSAGMPPQVDHLYDVPPAFPDSTAVGNWVTVSPGGNSYTNNVYLLGHYESGRFKNIKKVVFLSVDDLSYRFCYKEELSALADTVQIIKKDSATYVYYNFDTKQQVNTEPDKEVWDLAFAPYYDLATNFGVTIPYPVGGSFLNAGYTEAVLDSVNSFERIDASMIPQYEFIRQRDIPGYHWKIPNVNISSGSATYKVITNYSYIFHTSSDHYYKLRFLSYTHYGVSGYPQFEFIRLE
jgi:hypothetical protein